MSKRLHMPALEKPPDLPKLKRPNPLDDPGRFKCALCGGFFRYMGQKNDEHGGLVITFGCPRCHPLTN